MFPTWIQVVCYSIYPTLEYSNYLKSFFNKGPRSTKQVVLFTLGQKTNNQETALSFSRQRISVWRSEKKKLSENRENWIVKMKSVNDDASTQDLDPQSDHSSDYLAHPNSHPEPHPQPRRPRGFAAAPVTTNTGGKGKKEREKEKERTKLHKRHRRAITSRMLTRLCSTKISPCQRVSTWTTYSPPPPFSGFCLVGNGDRRFAHS